MRFLIPLILAHPVRQHEDHCSIVCDAIATAVATESIATRSTMASAETDDARKAREAVQAMADVVWVTAALLDTTIRAESDGLAPASAWAHIAKTVVGPVLCVHNQLWAMVGCTNDRPIVDCVWRGRAEPTDLQSDSFVNMMQDRADTQHHVPRAAEITWRRAADLEGVTERRPFLFERSLKDSAIDGNSAFVRLDAIFVGNGAVFDVGQLTEGAIEHVLDRLTSRGDGIRAPWQVLGNGGATTAGSAAQDQARPCAVNCQKMELCIVLSRIVSSAGRAARRRSSRPQLPLQKVVLGSRGPNGPATTRLGAWDLPRRRRYARKIRFRDVLRETAPPRKNACKPTDFFCAPAPQPPPLLSPSLGRPDGRAAPFACC